MFEFTKEQLRAVIRHTNQNEIFLMDLELDVLNKFIDTMAPGVPLIDRGGKQVGYLTAVERIEGILVARTSVPVDGVIELDVIFPCLRFEIFHEPKVPAPELISHEKPSLAAESLRNNYLTILPEHATLIRTVLLTFRTMVAEASDYKPLVQKELLPKTVVYRKDFVGNGRDPSYMMELKVFRVLEQYKSYVAGENGDVVDTVVYDMETGRIKTFDSRNLLTFAEIVDGIEPKEAQRPQPSKELFGEFLYNMLFPEGNV